MSALATYCITWTHTQRFITSSAVHAEEKSIWSYVMPKLYRSAEVGIAYDEWYQSLPKDARLLFFTLWNSRDMTACGTVKVTLATLGFETGMTRVELQPALE